MLDGIEINFVDPEEEKEPTPKERKRAQVINTIDEILANHPPVLPFNLTYLGIFGSRTLKGSRVEAIIGHYINSTGANVIVTAFEPEGICHMARNYCKERKIPLEIHFLNISKYARGAHEHRSDEVIKSADAVLYIHDGKSRGTYNEILRSIHFAKPYFYERLDVLKSEEIFCDVS